MVKKVLAGLCFIGISFIVFLFGLMKFLPVYIGGLLLFLSIFFTVLFFNERHRFKGLNQ